MVDYPDNHLTTREFWTKQHGDIVLPLLIQPEKAYTYFILDSLFRRYLQKQNEKKLAFLEIGCSPGAWMVYFHRMFGYDVSGVEYTVEGYNLTKENLKKSNVSGIVLQEDIFSTTLPPESFDVVFSFGLVEHFKDQEEIIKSHYRLLKKGGVLIIGVPNVFRDAVYGFIQWCVSPREYKKLREVHVHLDAKTLKERIARCTDLEELYCGYAGVVNFGVVNVASRGYWFRLLYD